MPGTTVDSTVRKEITTNSSAENWGNPDNKFAGGASDGKNTAAGYILGNKYVSGLKGKKSYFMIGDKIICMGSGITGGEGNVYTVIDNRVINKPSGSLSQPDHGLQGKRNYMFESGEAGSCEPFHGRKYNNLVRAGQYRRYSNVRFRRKS